MVPLTATKHGNLGFAVETLRYHGGGCAGKYSGKTTEVCSRIKLNVTNLAPALS